MTFLLNKGADVVAKRVETVWLDGTRRSGVVAGGYYPRSTLAASAIVNAFAIIPHALNCSAHRGSGLERLDLGRVPLRHYAESSSTAFRA
jgi:hypothetical protein